MSARILVVDDDPWILRMVTASLRKRQFAVDTARDGRQALERVKASVPDVIITDVMMPVMDGWTFVKQLRQDPRLAKIPVIFLTALNKDAAKLRSLGLTEQDYLSK
ncbi:MAG: response regulator, partial [Myxococcales bacterium]|nr:response regulator [Myxococcales bacterium]